MKYLALLFGFTLLNFMSFAQHHKPLTKKKVTDANDAITLLTPQYKTPYSVLQEEDIKSTIDRIFYFLDKNTPPRLIRKSTKEIVTDYSKIDNNVMIEPAAFRITSYEWGVTYSGMLSVGKITGDKRYKKYVADRLNFIANIAPAYTKLFNEGKTDPLMIKVVNPTALDDAGAMCTAMIKALGDSITFDGRPLIDRYINHIMNRQYRLPDGQFARNVPFKNSVWLDDMYMGIPAIVNMGKLTGDTKYYDEAVRQMKLFVDKMFIKEKLLFRHGWVEGMTDHPNYHWGRANGWAILTTVDVLDALPENYPGRKEILELLRNHIRGLAALQSGEGFWHQLLDRNDSYLETSCTAIYTYCIAHAINKGWIDAKVYTPIVVLGWNAVSTRVNANGEVEGTCVGTGMGFDPAFYYNRPQNNYAAHGYGPVILAGSETIKLIRNYKLSIEDNAHAIQVVETND